MMKKKIEDADHARGIWIPEQLHAPPIVSRNTGTLVQITQFYSNINK